MKHYVIKAVAVFAGISAMLGSLGACGGSSGGSSSGTVKIQFFQSKSESVNIVNKLIKEFEAQNPNIVVEQQNASDTLTVLKSRITKNNIPDVIAVNVSNYIDVVQAGILKDQTGTAAYKAIDSQTLLKSVQKAGSTNRNYMIPWSTNAQVVLYNKDEFSKLGLTVPTTWNEFVQTAQKVKAAGQQPFEFTWKDAWTAKLLMNSLAGPMQGDNFQTQLQKGSVTFSGSPVYQEAAKRMLQLKQFAQTDPFGTSYNDGNSAFANGKSVMYVQGIWAIPVIKAANPNINIGLFTLPTTSTPNQTKLLNAADSVIGVSNSSKNEAAAQKFLDFLMSKNAQKEYTDNQTLFSVRKDVPPATQELKTLKTNYIDKGQTCIYPDGMFSGASDLANITQSFLQKGDVNAYLKAVDNDYATNGIK